MISILLFDIGFLPVRIWDILDILIVGFLIYQIYKLLRGSIAFNIFVGVVLLYVVSWLVKALKMDLLSGILGQFVSVGVIILIIIFQPEVRRFLLLLGNSLFKQRSNFLNRLLDDTPEQKDEKMIYVYAIRDAMLTLAESKTGALIILGKNINLELFAGSGTQVNAVISQPLLESIFNKDAPLHDGAVIISEGLIKKASTVLPVSENNQLPKSIGLRHRAGVGVTENSNVAAFIVSEETGKVSFAYEGRLYRNIAEKKLTELLVKHFA